MCETDPEDTPHECIQLYELAVIMLISKLPLFLFLFLFVLLLSFAFSFLLPPYPVPCLFPRVVALNIRRSNR